jgi:pantothenate kinase
VPDRADPPPFAALVDRAARLADTGQRALLGIAGAPGAGKSTLAAALVQALGGRAVLVPMDGFHLDDAVLDALGRRGRKGAPDTFDADGYVALLRRLHERTDDVVYAPEFRRVLELAAAAAIPVPREIPLVVTEGNYLLHDGPFAPVRDLLTEAWFVEVDPEVRRARLVARHVGHGRSEDAARRWVATTDEPNALLVQRTRDRADLVVRVPS